MEGQRQDTRLRDEDDVALSDILHDFVRETGAAPITYAQLVERFGARSHETLLVFFTFPLCLPVPIPGVSTALGIAVTFVSLYLVLGRGPWLPQRLAQRVIAPATLRQMAGRLLIWLSRVERFIHPCWPALTHGRVLTRAHAVLLSVLGVLVMLPVPVPLANMVGATPMLLISLGLLERDGRCIVLGYLATLPCWLYYGALAVLGFEGMRQLLAAIT